MGKKGIFVRKQNKGQSLLLILHSKHKHIIKSFLYAKKLIEVFFSTNIRRCITRKSGTQRPNIPSRQKSLIFHVNLSYN